MRQKCPLRVKKFGCYLLEDDFVKRGCVSHLQLGERYKCESASEICKMCSGDTCNIKRSFERCKTCSSKNDVNCISKPWLSDDKTCPNYMDQCYVHVKDGIVKRNCIGDDFIKSVEQCANSSHCTHCTGFNCNWNVILPEVCIVCDSNKNEACKTISNLEENHFTQECPISVQTQGCYHFVDRYNRRHIRGTNQ